MTGNRPSRRQSSRRTILAAAIASGTVGLAGCLGGNDDSDSDPENGNSSDNGGNGNSSDDDPNGGSATDPSPDQFELAGTGAEDFSSWLVPDLVAPQEETELICDYLDFEEAISQDATQFVEFRATIADELNIDPTTLTGELLVAAPGDGGTQQIYLGSFPKADVVDRFTVDPAWETAGEYQGYTVIGPAEDTDAALVGAAIGTDAVLNTPAYAQHIDAAVGEGPSLADTDEDAALLFDLLPAGVQTAVSYHPSLADLAINGEVSAEYVDQALSRSVRTFVFETDSDATTDRAREIMENGVGFAEIHTEETHGRAVMVEYTPTGG